MPGAGLIEGMFAYQSVLPDDLLRTLAAGGPLVESAIAVAVLVVGIILFLVLRRDRRPWIVVDGSNVMHWVDDTPSLRTLRLVVDATEAAGFRPLVWFDANAGYKLQGRYRGPEALARDLGLAERHVRVAPKGTPADPLLLGDARRLKATVVSNDRFRDWQAQFPEILPEARMVRGQVRGGALTLALS